MAAPQPTWFRAAAIVATLYAAALCAAGIHNALDDLSDPYPSDAKLVSLNVSMVVFLPLVAIAWRRPHLGSNLLFCVAGGTVVALAVPGSDGAAAAAVGGVGIIGLPMLATGFLFRWRATH